MEIYIYIYIYIFVRAISLDPHDHLPLAFSYCMIYLNKYININF